MTDDAALEQMAEHFTSVLLEKREFCNDLVRSADEMMKKKRLEQQEVTHTQKLRLLCCALIWIYVLEVEFFDLLAEVLW